MPGIYTKVFLALLSNTLATDRLAEFGFLGAILKTRKQYPFF
jgi:hypothetical protein